MLHLLVRHYFEFVLNDSEKQASLIKTLIMISMTSSSLEYLILKQLIQRDLKVLLLRQVM